MSTDAKKTLRKSLKSTLSSLSEAEITKQSHQAQNQILTNLPQYRNAKRISIYLSMPKSESQTDLIVKDAFDAGKTVFVPYIHRPPAREGELQKRSIIDMLRLNSSREYEGLDRDGWGIPSLPAEGIEGKENASGGKGVVAVGAGDKDSEGEGGLDLVVVPGVAFDADLNRLGHGAGYYDEFLTRYCGGGRMGRPFLGMFRIYLVSFRSSS